MKKITVNQVTQISRSADLDWDESIPLTPEAAIAVAKSTGRFQEGGITSVIYEVHSNDPEGCQVTQVAGRAASADKNAGEGGKKS